jgi:phosphonoacetate hydrolase
MIEVHSPERPGGQGLDHNQEESGNRAILALLRDPEVADHVDLVITCRDGCYEVWAARGMIRFQRRVNGDGPEFGIVEQVGKNPIADQSHQPIDSCAGELRAAAASGHATEDVNRAFIEPSQVSYPYAYERIAQLFDSPYAPDIVISPKCYAFGLQPGQHGALDVVQSRAPLAFAGPGIKPGVYETAPRHVDIAPTVCRLMGFPLIDGKNWAGRTSSERGVAPDVYLKRQDGRVLEEILEPSNPSLVYFVIFDGLSHSELCELRNRNDPAITNLRRILDRSAFFRFGSTVNFPSITWPSHSTIFTGAWCGHHDIVNPTYYARETRQALAPQGQGMMTEGYLGSEVETLYEAFHRVLGPQAFTASIHEPQGRGADHAALERRVVGPRDRLKALTAELMEEINPRYMADGREGVYREALLDARGLAQVMILFDDPSHPAPVLVAHELTITDGAGHEYGPHSEGLRAAVAESDRRLGQVLDMLEAKGLLESTLFVFTSDHGMAATDVSLHANPARHPERIGMKTVTGEPMIWLRDLDVRVERAPDGRTARVTVFDNDADESGEKPPICGAEVLVHCHPDDLVARVTTNDAGVAGFATPADVPAHEIVLSVQHPDYNPRHLRLDGMNLAIDLRRALYG